MTRLIQFLILLGIIFGTWTVLLKQFYMENDSFSKYILLPAPLHLLILFGMYSVFTVLHRTFNFNDCPEASKELNQQIEEAKADLKKKGLKF